MKDSVVAPHLSTPAAAGNLRALPYEILEQTCKRVGIASMAFAGIWAWALLMNTVVWRIAGSTRFFADTALLSPANLIILTGILLSVAMVFVAGALHHRPNLLIDIGLGYAVLNALLIALINWLIIPPEWYPSAGVSFVCVIILVYPTIAPAGPYRTLAAALLAASMDPLLFGVSVAQGNVYDLGRFDLLWTFGPNYVCALMAVVPATGRAMAPLPTHLESARSLSLSGRTSSGTSFLLYISTRARAANPVQQPSGSLNSAGIPSADGDL